MTESTNNPTPAATPGDGNDSDAMAAELDLTPRSTTAGPSNSSKLRNRLIVGTVSLVLGFVLFQALTSATEFFHDVDVAIEQRDELGDRTFRMHGVVVSEQVRDDAAITFEVAYNDASTIVRHIGEEPTDLFELGIDVVVKGHWEDQIFVSQQILIKHSESYVAENSDRSGVGQDSIDGYSESGS